MIKNRIHDVQTLVAQLAVAYQEWYYRKSDGNYRSKMSFIHKADIVDLQAFLQSRQSNMVLEIKYRISIRLKKIKHNNQQFDVSGDHGKKQENAFSYDDVIKLPEGACHDPLWCHCSVLLLGFYVLAPVEKNGMSNHAFALFHAKTTYLDRPSYALCHAQQFYLFETAPGHNGGNNFDEAHVFTEEALTALKCTSMFDQVFRI